MGETAVFHKCKDQIDKSVLVRALLLFLSVPDAIIAATAVYHNLTLVTLNQSDFAHIASLSLRSIPQQLSKVSGQMVS